MLLTYLSDVPANGATLPPPVEPTHRLPQTGHGPHFLRFTFTTPSRVPSARGPAPDTFLPFLSSASGVLDVPFPWLLLELTCKYPGPKRLQTLPHEARLAMWN